jgi:transketolase
MMTKTRDVATLERIALQIRRDSIRMVKQAGSGHPGGAMGAADIFAVLYGSVLNNTSTTRAVDGPDRFVLSNGHICAGWYSALTLAGFFPREELKTHRKMGARLQGHPSRHKFPEVVETSTGPLGQGLSVASGIALGKRMRGEVGNVYCLTGDGELQEGMVWETALTAAHKGLANLCLIVADNGVQIDGPTSEVKKVRSVGDKFSAFGWHVLEIDGHDVTSLLTAFDAAKAETGRPTCIVATTTMAKGVGFMEDDPKWHGACPTDDEYERALTELGRAGDLGDF